MSDDRPETPACPACGSSASPSAHMVPGEYFCNYDGCYCGVWNENGVTHLRSEVTRLKAELAAARAEIKLLRSKVWTLRRDY